MQTTAPQRMSWEERANRRRQMAQMVKDGRDPGSVAAKFQVSMATVRDACRANGVSLPSAHKTNPA